MWTVEQYKLALSTLCSTNQRKSKLLFCTN
jgi:hypothetical protein